jgi:hypothetical protein
MQEVIDQSHPLLFTKQIPLHPPLGADFEDTLFATVYERFESVKMRDQGAQNGLLGLRWELHDPIDNLRVWNFQVQRGH